MIKSIKASNFRRHSDLDLRFDEDHQLILISGANGSGKSTILEVIMYAMFGEGRYGRRGLDSLVKRGCELEGMNVELVFTMGDVVYRVHRRRDGKTPTAVLYANDIALTEGVIQVSREIGLLLGMDSAGFKLAVIAQQKDLDGLASLRPSERSQMVSRLLRLDIVTAARIAASTKFRSERDIAKEIQSENIEDLKVELHTLNDLYKTSQTELASAKQEIIDIDAKLEATTTVTSAWQDCINKVAKIEGGMLQLKTSRAQTALQLEAIIVPEVPIEPQNTFTLTELTNEISRVERELTQAETALDTKRAHATVTEELDRVNSIKVELTTIIEELKDDKSQELEDQVAIQLEKVNSSAAAQQIQNNACIKIANIIETLEEHLAHSKTLQAECDSCGQSISDQHRDKQINNITRELTDAKTNQTKFMGEHAKAQEQNIAAKAILSELTNALERARANKLKYDRALSDLVDIQRRIANYQAQISRLKVVEYPTDELYARKAELVLSISAVDSHTQLVKAQLEANTNIKHLTAQLATIDADIATNLIELVAAQPDSELQNSYQARCDVVSRREEELLLVTHWDKELAVLSSTIDAVEKRIAMATATNIRRQTHQNLAVAAQAASRLLDATSDVLATQIRPSLQGAVSVILAAMSQGRFSAVKISDEYDITVQDDGKFRPLTELSGGEMDLVALSVRLALSQIVSERHGSGGAGFLILDECFASQDSNRRRSILEALRNLRDVYSQIFLISHVEDMEEYADCVISLAVDQETQETLITAG